MDMQLQHGGAQVMQSRISRTLHCWIRLNSFFIWSCVKEQGV